MSSRTRVQAPFPGPFRMEPRSRWSPTKATGCWCSRGRTVPDTCQRTMRPECFWLIPLSRQTVRILPRPIRRILAEQLWLLQMERMRLPRHQTLLRTTAVLQTKPARMRLPHRMRDIRTAPWHRMQVTGTPMRLLPTTRGHLIRLLHQRIRTLPLWVHPAAMRRPLHRKPIPARQSAAIRTCRHSMMPISPHRTQR